MPHFKTNCILGMVGVVAWLANPSGAAQDMAVIGFSSTVLENSPLPEALSDMTAVLDLKTGKVFIHGGCNSTKGNEFVPDFGIFACSSISTSAYVFDIPTQSFNKIAPMPVARYRHVAVFIDNQVWVVGGRNLTDGLVAQVDVYDVGADTWKTYSDLNNEYVTSDQAAFVLSDMVYIAGGYDVNYTALDTVFSIDPMASTTTGQLVVALAAPLPTARGDISAVVATDATTSEPYALVTGGFTHEDNFCEPRTTSERFNVETGVWTETQDLVVSRADKALVVLGGDRVFALGGERKIPDFCLLTADEVPEPGEESLPIVDVEWYNEASDTWTVIANLTRHRFRFAAVGFNDSIFSFGGQLMLDTNCTCFKTSNEVIVYKEEFGPVSGGFMNSLLGAGVVAVGFMLLSAI